MRQDIHGKHCYNYMVSDPEAIQKHKKHLTCVNGRYFRVFCSECSCTDAYGGSDYSEYRKLEDCRCHKYEEEGSCGNLDLGMLSSETQRIVCLNHKEDVIAVNGQCDYCFKLMRSKKWINGLKQCNTCQKNICQDCREEGCHDECEEEQRMKWKKLQKYETDSFYYYDASEYGLYYFQCEKAYDEWCDCPWYREYDVRRSYDYNVFVSDNDADDYVSYVTKYIEIDFVSDGYNEHLLDYDFVKSADKTQKNKNFVKKSSRKRMKNKKKYGSYQKRQLDKRGNNKRSKRRREIKNIIKNEMLNL